MLDVTRPRRSAGTIVESWLRDFAHAARRLRRAPGFALVIILTLGLAIGANAAIFSVIDKVLLNPLAFPDADELVTIRASFPEGSDLPGEWGPGLEFYAQYKEHAKGLADLGVFRAAQTTVRSGDNVERLFMTQASSSLFSTLRIQPVAGRLPNDDDGANTALISYGLWSSWFGRDTAVLGSTLEVSGQPRTVIGVMPANFRFPSDQMSVWIAGRIGDRIAPGNFGFNLVGRLAKNAKLEGLAAELAPIAQRLPEVYGGSPGYQRTMAQHRPVVRSLEATIVGDVKRPLWVIGGTVAVILLIACANVANLLIVRAESRRRDLAVRLALGAARSSLIRAQMSEALLLGLVGGLVGVLVAWAGVPVLVQAAPEGIPRLDTVGIDGAVLVFTIALSVFAACLFGLLPALRFSTPDAAGSIRETTRTVTGRDHFLRDTLVVVQTGAALVLLVGSGLLVKSFRELNRVDPGYETSDILTFQMAPDPRAHALRDGPTYAAFHYDFMDRLGRLPGVTSVGLVQELPLDEGAGTTRIVTEQTVGSGRVPPLMRMTHAGGAYFQTMGIRLLQGRDFERNDVPTGSADAIVSEAAARQLWPDEDPLGKQVRLASDTAGWLTVIGVVEDVKLADFRQRNADPIVYLPLVGRTAQSWAVGTPVYVVKSARAEIMGPEVRALVRDVTPSAPVYRMFTMAGLAARSYAQLSFTMLTLAIAAALALILGAVGLYAVLSYVVSQRTREIGIRMALGAEVGMLRRMVVMQGGRVALIGVAIGVGVSLVATRVLESLLFGVGKLDVATFVSMSAVMLAVAMLASYLPARRASEVDPVRALRAE